jgi:hypothetical protein
VLRTSHADVPVAWEDENGDLHVTGTHDMGIARDLAAAFVCSEWDMTGAQAAAEVTGFEPRRWWALPEVPPGGDVLYRPVPEDTPGAVPVTTWT